MGLLTRDKDIFLLALSMNVVVRIGYIGFRDIHIKAGVSSKNRFYNLVVLSMN